MEDLHQIRSDIQELKINSATIKLEIAETKTNISEQMEKISNSLITLAQISEKMNTNTEDHRRIHSRIDDIDDTLQQNMVDYAILKQNFKNYEDRRREDLQLEIQEDQNSIIKKIRNSVLEWSAIGFFAFLLYLFYDHASSFLKMIKG